MLLKNLKTWAKRINWKKVLPVLLVLYVLFACTTIAFKMRYDAAPDESMKYSVVNYVADNMQLPHGGDEAVRDARYGNSYAIKPFVSYTLSGFVVHFVRIFTNDFRIIIFAARMVNVLFLVGYTIMILLISKKLFKGVWRALFAMAATLVPQVLFIGGYLNNDAIALFAVAFIVYAWLSGLETKWNIKSCALLGVGLGVCALSYYNAFGYILCSVIIFAITAYQFHMKFLKFLGRGLMIFAIAFGLAGWHYIRNAIIYNGDAFDLHTSEDYAEKYADSKHKPSTRETLKKQGISLKDMISNTNWVESTSHSFFGKFGGMSVEMSYLDYIVYQSVFAVGIIGSLAGAIYLAYYFVKRRRRIMLSKRKVPSEEKVSYTKITLSITMAIAALIPIVLSIYYSYAVDYQPQGRYIMPALIPFVYFMVCGYRFLFKKLENIKRNIFLGILFVFMIIAPFSAFFLHVFKVFAW